MARSPAASSRSDAGPQAPRGGGAQFSSGARSARRLEVELDALPRSPTRHGRASRRSRGITRATGTRRPSAPPSTTRSFTASRSRRGSADGDIVSGRSRCPDAGFYGDSAQHRGRRPGVDAGDKQRLLDSDRESLARDRRREDDGRWGTYRRGPALRGGEGFRLVRECVGHGMGRRSTRSRQVPNYGPGRISPPFAPGMILAIEPMVNAGGTRSSHARDDWTGSPKIAVLSVHFEHTVAVSRERRRRF